MSAGNGIHARWRRRRPEPVRSGPPAVHQATGRRRRPRSCPGLIHPLRAQWGAPAAPSSHVHAGRRVGRSRRGLRRAVDPARAGPAERRRHGQRRRSTSIWQVAIDPGDARRDPRRHRHRASRERARRVRQRGRTGQRHLVLLSVQLRRGASRIGRTRTFPRRVVLACGMRFALVSCQDFEAGYYAAYRDIAAQDLDFVVHVGDYIYETAADPNVPAERRHTGGETIHGRRLSQPLRAYRLDRAPAGRARRVSRSSSPGTTTRSTTTTPGLIPEDDQTAQEFLRAARQRVPGVYARRCRFGRTSARRTGRLNLYRSLRFGDLARVLRARRPAVAQRSTVRRRFPGAAGVPGHSRSDRHDAG